FRHLGGHRRHSRTHESSDDQPFHAAPPQRCPLFPIGCARTASVLISCIPPPAAIVRYLHRSRHVGAGDWEESDVPCWPRGSAPPPSRCSAPPLCFRARRRRSLPCPPTTTRY